MLNTNQIEALKKLATTGPAITERGVAKFADGTTLNGNMENKLRALGLIEKFEAGTRQIYVRDIRQHRTAIITGYRITEAGKAAINA